jgi:hypothetical protein
MHYQNGNGRALIAQTVKSKTERAGNSKNRTRNSRDSTSTTDNIKITYHEN